MTRGGVGWGGAESTQNYKHQPTSFLIKPLPLNLVQV